MSTTHPSNGPKKRKQTSDSSNPPKKPCAEAAHSLIGPHEAIIAELSPKYNVLAASVISSTQIRKRVAHITSHLLDNSTEKPRVALLHARAADVCKMITVVEQCKRTISETGKMWYQYNQLFDLPAESKRRDVVEETVLQRELEDDSDSESDAFEPMESRFENAVLPPPRTRAYKSLRIFLSLEVVPELKSREDVTVQSSEEAKA